MIIVTSPTFRAPFLRGRHWRPVWFPSLFVPITSGSLTGAAERDRLRRIASVVGTVSISGPTGPGATGWKVTPNVQLLPGPISWPTQVCAAANTPDPATDLTRVRAFCPFAAWMVTNLGLLAVPARTLLKVSLVGESVTIAGPGSVFTYAARNVATSTAPHPVHRS